MSNICRKCALILVGALVLASSVRAGGSPISAPTPSQSSLVLSCRGFCVNGSFCTDSTCPTTQCYLPDALPSLLMCGGVGDGCGGLGTCVPVVRSLRWMSRFFTFVIDHAYCDANGCYDSSTPISQVVCGGAFTPGCGVGHCGPQFIGTAYEDACSSYPETSPVSKLLCGCRRAREEVTPGCGLGICDGGAFCDNCFCYTENSPVTHRFCPGGARTFQKVYVKPGFTYDHALAGIETLDYGFLMAGASSDGSGLALRTDPEGNILWSRKYRTTSVINGLADAGDGFLLGGNTLVKTDSAGSVVWSKKLPGPAKALQVMADGSIVVAGDLSGDVYLLKTRGDGTLLWARQFGGSGKEEAWSVVRILYNGNPGNDGFLLAGSTESFGAGADDLFFVRTDSAGALLWAKTVGGSAREGNDISPYRTTGTRDGGFIATGRTESFGQGEGDMLVVKLDAAGVVKWAKAYGGLSSELPATVAETLDGYFVIGDERSFVGGRVLLSLDANGGLRWAHSFGPDEFAGYSAGGVAVDGGAFIATESHRLPVGQASHRFYLLKTDATGRTRGCCDQENVPLVETPLAIQSQLQAGVVQTTLTPTLANAGATASDYSLSPVTICESSADRLCNGILTGACLCEGECKKALLGADFGGTIWDVDRATGATSNPRATGVGSLAGIAFSPTGLLYGLTASLDGGSALYRINPLTGTATLVGPTGLSSLLEGDIAVDANGTIYGMYGFGLTLFRLDPNTGAATIVGPLQGVVDPSAMAFDDKGTLYVLDGTAGVLHVVDKTTGATIKSVMLKPPLPAHTIEGMSFCPQVQKLYVSIGAVAGTPMLMTLNPVSGVLLKVVGRRGATDLSGLAFHP